MVSASTAAANELAAGLASLSQAGSTPTPEPQGSAPTTVPPAAPPPVAAPADSAQPPSGAPTGAQQAPASITIDPSTLPPEARRFLEMHGDVATALIKGLEYNNRLGKNGQPTVSDEPPVEAAPTEAPTAEPEPPAAPVVLDEAKVTEHVRTLLNGDPECSQIVRDYNVVGTQLQQLVNTTIPNIEKEITLQNLRLELPEVKANEIAAADIKDRLRELKADLREAKDIKRDHQNDLADLNSRWERAKVKHTQAVEAKFRDEVTERQRTAEYQTQINTHAARMAQAWPQAVTQAVTKHQIPENLVAEFKEWARDSALASLELGHKLDDAFAYVDTKAQKFVAMIDRAHRAQSGVYAQQAAARAAVPAPPPAPVAAPVQPQTTGDPMKDMAAVQRAMEREMAEGMRALRGA
jgi:hypothetical protein